jgi:NAD(P)-dependent dehydrogenase (short-subunit alcohol dehydrogenase family)
MGKLTGKVAIVTGASTGMGRAIGVALAAEGANLGLVARNPKRLEESAVLARDAGVEVLAFPGDVGDPATSAIVVRQVFEKFGRIDILVNNAGTNVFHRNWPDTTVPDWNLVINTNLSGAFYFARQVLPVMRKAGGGIVINISSGAGLHAGAPGGVAYTASKHGMQALTGTLNAEERRYGIRSCAICPGETDTPNLDLRPRPPSSEALAKMLTSEDIANAVAYVATQPDSVAIELLVITPTARRNYAADYERYSAEGHTAVKPEDVLDL